MTKSLKIHQKTQNSHWSANTRSTFRNPSLQVAQTTTVVYATSDATSAQIQPEPVVISCTPANNSHSIWTSAIFWWLLLVTRKALLCFPDCLCLSCNLLGNSCCREVLPPKNRISGWNPSYVVHRWFLVGFPPWKGLSLKFYKVGPVTSCFSGIIILIPKEMAWQMGFFGVISFLMGGVSGDPTCKPVFSGRSESWNFCGSMQRSSSGSQDQFNSVVWCKMWGP